MLPAITLQPRAYLLVFASGKNRASAGSELHANFKTDSSGEYLALLTPDVPRQIASEFAPAFPEQRPDVAYGRLPSGALGYFENPTPGAPNDTTAVLEGIVARPTPSQRHGHYDEPFDVELHTSTPNVQFRYTLDGSVPTTTEGTIYVGPIEIAGTPDKPAVTLRAIAFRNGYLDSKVTTITYVFLDEVLY